MNRCKSCQSEIKWVLLKSGKRMPVDPLPLETPESGTIIKVWPDGEAEVIKQLGDLDDYCTYYRSHFATCPDADDWRTKPPSKAKMQLSNLAKRQKEAEWGKSK